MVPTTDADDRGPDARPGTGEEHETLVRKFGFPDPSVHARRVREPRAADCPNGRPE